MEITLTKKQMQALKILRDNETTELLYGGAAGGGKSFLGCLWIILSCLEYPGTRWVIARARLADLKKSTLNTFFEIIKLFSLNKKINYNPMSGIIKWDNDSEIYLKDLYANPSDPEFMDLGSMEITGVFIDEGSEVSEKGYNILKSRIRFKLEQYNLIPKTLIGSNPYKNFLYREFYKPYKENTLPKYRKFLKAFVWENPFISKHYIEELKKLDKITVERLFQGNWEYSDEPSRLFDYDKLCNIFTNNPTVTKPSYISVDVARFGMDKTVIIIWRGLHIIKVYSNVKQSTKDTRLFIEKLANEFEIPRGNIIIDEDGVGGGIVDEMHGIKGFINNSKPVETEYTKLRHNFANLKSQCYFYLADMVNQGRISCVEISPEARKMIIEDLEQIKWKDPDKDNKVAVTPKEEIKENIGRSPDFGDCMMMRMFFDVIPARKEFYIA